MLHTTIDHVLALDDLRPSPAVNALFEQLVAHIVDPAEQATTFAPALQARVRDVAAASEGEMEMYWAKRIQTAADPAAELSLFPYAHNYEQLVGREIALIEASGKQLEQGQRLLMIGSGPLPMTALECSRQRGLIVDHVDISPSAIEACRALSERLNIKGEHIVADGRAVALHETYDVVLIAGLASETIEQKQAIIDRVLPSLRPGGRVLVRSAAGLRSLLYPPVPARGFAGVKLLSEYHPTDEVINSVFIYEKES